MSGESADSSEDRETGIYGHFCPVCGVEFTDSVDDLEENESYSARICVDQADDESDGKMHVHLSESVNQEGVDA